MTDELEIWKKLNECEAAKKAFGSWWLEGDVFLDPSNQQMGRLHRGNTACKQAKCFRNA